MSSHPSWVIAAALADLPLLAPPLLWPLAARWSVEELWHGLGSGSLRADDLRTDDEERVILTSTNRANWASAVRSADLDEVRSRYVEAGVRVLHLGGPGYPARLAADAQPPVVLFCQGDLRALEPSKAVAIVGTRKASAYGRQVAKRFGSELARDGVSVVSGLALGIDGAAHEGALQPGARAAVVGVVGSGLDHVYPARHAALWRQVAERGVLVSETPLGRPPLPFRFPLRNRIIAALADVVLVVESGITGGSMITASQANERNRRVLAVPGPILAESSAGTNSLLALGTADICTGMADVATALGLATVGRPTGITVDPRPVPEGADVHVLRSLGWDVASTDSVMVRTGCSFAAATLSLTRLEVAGWVARGPAGWYRLAALGER